VITTSPGFVLKRVAETLPECFCGRQLRRLKCAASFGCRRCGLVWDYDTPGLGDPAEAERRLHRTEPLEGPTAPWGCPF